jgi:hypothetical protein
MKLSVAKLITTTNTVMTFSIMTLRIMTLSIMALNIMTLNIITHSLMMLLTTKFVIITLNIIKLSKNDTQNNYT